MSEPSKEKLCEQCQGAMKLVPPGYSRMKNKPYGAFWSCDRRNGGCGKTEKAESGEGPAQASAGGSDRQQLDRIEAGVKEILQLLKA